LDKTTRLHLEKFHPKSISVPFTGCIQYVLAFSTCKNVMNLRVLRVGKDGSAYMGMEVYKGERDIYIGRALLFAFILQRQCALHLLTPGNPLSGK
jgi:hypothetical protein